MSPSQEKKQQHYQENVLYGNLSCLGHSSYGIMCIQMKQRRIYNKILLVVGMMSLTACGEKTFGNATPEADKQYDETFGNATHEAAKQYDELASNYKEIKDEEELEEVLAAEAEVIDLLTHFDKTADVHYATRERGITMLHLACLFKKPELARCLLLEGANPNARARDAYGEVYGSPLSYALLSSEEGANDTEQIIQLLNLLANNGADTKGSVYYDQPLITTAILICAHEDVVRHLLKYTPPISVDDIALIMERGWANALEDILKTKASLTPEEQACIVCAGCIIKGDYDGKTNMRMVESFLSRGVDINSTYMGTTLLLEASANLSFATDEEFLNNWVDYIAYLISKGADVTHIAGAESAHAGLCAYDMLANRPGVLKALAARGHHLTAPPMVIRDGKMLIDDLTRAGMRQMSAEAARPYLKQITSVFSPTQEQMEDISYSNALLSATEILSRISPEYAAAVINASPLWQIAPSAHQHEEAQAPCHGVSAATLIYVLRDVYEVCVDSNKILQVIRQAEEINDSNLSALSVELLGRDPQTAAIVEELLHSPNLSIQAGAWSAKLQHMGLPCATNGAVINWLAKHGLEADTPAIRTALTATSLAEMWYGDLSDARKAEFIQALRTIGAPESAIKVYSEYANNMDNPEKLDELEAQGKDWSYELEIATARYIVQHADDFLKRIQQSKVDK